MATPSQSRFGPQHGPAGMVPATSDEKQQAGAKPLRFRQWLVSADFAARGVGTGEPARGFSRRGSHKETVMATKNQSGQSNKSRSGNGGGSNSESSAFSWGGGNAGVLAGAATHRA